MSGPIHVYVGVPSYDGRIHAEVFTALFNASRQPQSPLGFIQIQSQSWLCRNFNACLAMALNMRDKGITHFLLLHEDVAIQSADWLNKMVAIAEDKKADVLSVVSPLKVEKGLTSTALDNGVGHQVRRLTLKEIYKDYEPTFTAPNLLVNTGLILIDLRTSIFADPANVKSLAFTMVDEIKFFRPDTGEAIFTVDGVPEDWHFSRQIREMGASIWATREIPVVHRVVERGVTNSLGERWKPIPFQIRLGWKW